MKGLEVGDSGKRRKTAYTKKKNIYCIQKNKTNDEKDYFRPRGNVRNDNEC